MENSPFPDEPADCVGGRWLPAFLAHGETTASEKYGETVEKAIRYLCAKQNEKGEFSKITPNGAAPVYTQAICVYAISEAYGMTRIGSLKEVMEKGVQCIINGQQPGGGFDYSWKKESRRDTSLGGWCCQAMKAAYIAGAENQGLHEAMEKSIKDMKGAQREDGYFIYADGRGRITNMTAVACLSMQLLGHGEDKEVKDGMKFLNDADCSWDKPAECPLYAWYYLSQAKFHVGGNTWSSWNNKFAPLYIRHQNPDGSWLSPGVTGFKEGKDTVEREWMGSDIDSKVYATTLAALTLQVYYRFLPTYKTIETVTEEASDGDVAIEILKATFILSAEVAFPPADFPLPRRSPFPARRFVALGKEAGMRWAVRDGGDAVADGVFPPPARVKLLDADTGVYFLWMTMKKLRIQGTGPRSAGQLFVRFRDIHPNRWRAECGEGVSDQGVRA